MGQVADKTLILLSHVPVLPLHLSFEMPPDFPSPTVGLLRGVWGRALHDHAESAYREVFHPESESPCYVLRVAHTFEPALELILIGDAIAHCPQLLKAWGVAEMLGIGADRLPFRVKGIEPVQLGNPPALADGLAPQKLSDAVPSDWQELATERCTVRLLSPLSLVSDKKFVSQPKLDQLVRAILRRIYRSTVGQYDRAQFGGFADQLAQLAAATSGYDSWTGDAVSVARKSAARPGGYQRNAVIGEFELPYGAGDLLPLLMAGQWLGVGKQYTAGLGHFRVEH